MREYTQKELIYIAIVSLLYHEFIDIKYSFIEMYSKHVDYISLF